MALPRGLKRLVATQPGRLSRGKVKGYRPIDKNGVFIGGALRGITKRLAARVYSQCEPPVDGGGGWVPPSWRGADGGRRRGCAVDAQVSRLAGVSKRVRATAKMLKLTRLTFSALDGAGIEPLIGQRVVLSSSRKLATACDVVGFCKDTNSLVVAEVKTGFGAAGGRTAPARDSRSSVQYMKGPLKKATDCNLHRHLAQLAATRELLVQEPGLVKKLRETCGIETVRGVLLYVSNDGTEMHKLPDWWCRKGTRILDAIS
jgi:hypothetical protein